MNFLRIKVFVVFFALSGTLLSQRNIGQIQTIDLATKAPVSNIILSSQADSVLLKIELKDAQYDHTKNNLPYFLASKVTAYNQSANATLIIKKTQLVAEPHATNIKKALSKFLTQNFEIIPVPSLCKNENLNQQHIIPFRMNEQNQVEELVDYSLNWQVFSSNRSFSTAAAFKNNSVLATGTWYKIGITKTGFHKIDKTLLTSIGISVTGLNPKNIKIYGNGGRMLPELNSAFRYDDLEENAIQVAGEGDGVFDDTDYIVFYGKGPTGWTKTGTTSGLKFRHEKNIYSDTSFYFINVDAGSGKRVNTPAAISAPSNVNSSSYDYYNFEEKNYVNFVKSGRQFYGEYFDITNTYGFTWTDGDFVLGDSIFSEVTIAGRGINGGVFNIFGSGLNYNLNTGPVNINNYLADYVDVQTAVGKSILTDPNSIGVAITKQTSNCVAWLDKITVNARRKLHINSKQFEWRDLRSVGTGSICNYTFTNPLSIAPIIWNITDPVNPYVQSYNSVGTTISFAASSDSLNSYGVLPGSDFYTPAFVGKVINQNLHNIQQADYVVITHPLFMAQAQRLANIHQQQEGLTYAVVSVDQIYNEFSSGRPDISGIRDFIRMLYSRGISTGKQVKYVAIVGDGSFDNINRNLNTNSNLVPTYQTYDSKSYLNSTASDDFYGLMDPNEGASAEALGILDIGVGRLVCRNITEVTNVINKIENYYRKDPNFKIEESAPENCNSTSASPFGDWRNWVVFLADDEDQSTHMSQADQLSNMVQSSQPNYNLDKIYLDAYQQFSTAGGQRVPDAAADLLKRFKKGALVFNYTGHGGEVGITGERILDVPAINGLDNYNKLPLFVTATCEFSRYDDPDRTSAGELCLLNPKGGSIALLTTCRLAFSSTNFVLNTTLFNYLFKKLPNGKMPALGDVIQKTKAALSQSIYFANFHLLGDPAMPLAYPQQRVITSKINNNLVTSTSVDTISALAKVTVSGFVADTSGNKLTNFNGIVYPTVFDKEENLNCLLNDAESYYTTIGNPFNFKLQKNILYRGKAEVKNGDFSFSFIVPKDISFAIGPGKISYYATNGQFDAGGYTNKVKVGGSAKNPLVDNDGPQMAIYLNDKGFVNGGTTSEKPILYANLTDSSGINTLGSSIGHDITVVLDENSSKPIVLNDYYEANLNSYQSGKVRFPFDELADGNHRITFKAWDIQNNSAITSTDFVVAHSAELALKHVLNYPNPFTTNTKFFLEHNQACNPLKITIQIFTISGKMVKTIQKTVTCEGFRPEGVEWDGKDEYGDKLARGVYVYKLAIINTDNQKAEKTEKLVILN